MYDLRLHVVPLTNEPGNPPLKSYTVTPQEFSQVIDRVNLVYAGTNIRFLFDPEFDWAPLANTEINTDGSNQRTLCNQIADAFPGKIVCFLRWGSGTDPTGNGNAYPPPGAGTKPPSVDDVVQNYVALPNKVGPGFAYLSLGNGSFVAHELGHFLGLYHTFPGWTDLNGPVYAQFNGTMPSAAQADQAVIDYIAANGGTTEALNGDALSDTPPDPSPVLYTAHNQNICSSPQITVQGTLNGRRAAFTFTPDVNNVMSYFGGCPPPDAGPTHFHFSAQQIQRFDVTLKHQSRRALIESPLFGAHALQTGNAIARGPDRLDVLATDVNGRVWFGHWAQTTPGGNWNHWRPVLPDISSANAPVGVVSRHPNKLDIFVPGSDSRTYTGALDKNFASGQWRGWWNILTGAIPPGGAVTAVSRDPNKLDIFIVSTDGGVYTAAWDQNVANAQWRGWWRIGNLVATPGAPVAVVSRDPNKLDIFVAGSDGRTYTAAWDANVANGAWRGWWNILTGAIPAGGTITAVSRHPEKLDIFLASTDGGVYTAAWDQHVANAQWRGWWRVGNLTTVPGAPVAAVARDPNKLDIFAAANDGRTYTAAWDANVANGAWRGWWNILTGAIHPGWPVAAVSRDPGKLDIFIVSTDGRIYTAAWAYDVANGQWQGWWRIGV
jgi:hypothetical protein